MEASLDTLNSNSFHTNSFYSEIQNIDIQQLTATRVRDLAHLNIIKSLSINGLHSMSQYQK